MQLSKSWLLVPVLVVVAISLPLGLALRSSDGEGGASESPSVPTPGQFQTAVPQTELGPGAPVPLQGARLTTLGQLQVVATGGSCKGVSDVHVEETPEAIEVVVKVAKVGDGPCPADTAAWFVAVPLEGDLDQRPLLDGSSDPAKRIDIERCELREQASTYCNL